MGENTFPYALIQAAGKRTSPARLHKVCTIPCGFPASESSREALRRFQKRPFKTPLPFFPPQLRNLCKIRAARGTVRMMV